MTINYSLKEEFVEEEKKEKVIATITVPENQEIRDLGEKTKVVADLEARIAKCQGVIDSHTAMIAEIQTKLDAISAL